MRRCLYCELLTMGCTLFQLEHDFSQNIPVIQFHIYLLNQHFRYSFNNTSMHFDSYNQENINPWDLHTDVVQSCFAYKKSSLNCILSHYDKIVNSK